MKKNLFLRLFTLLFLICLFVFQGHSQNVVITGKVLEQETLKPILGATVSEKNGKQKVTTNALGVFTISTAKGSSLVISVIGYQEKQVVIGASNLIIELTPSTSVLSDVVVTALGIKRNEKSLGYAAQSVNENAVKDAKTNNWVNSLSGKVAGLNIQGTGGGPMGSSRITLRGENSLNLDNNQALIVIDGVPVSNKITGTGYSSNLAADGPVDYGSDLSDINPDDIENITVLKGPGATALYGSRAAGGALIITTKTGSKNNNKIGVTYNSNLSIDQVNRWPDYQYDYGEGRTISYYSYGDSKDGINTSTGVAAGRAWGPKFNGQSYFQYDPTTPNNLATDRTPWVAYPNYIKGFFQTGKTTTNSISIEGGNDKSSARLSISHLDNTWIVPNTGYQRTSASLSVNHQVSDKLKISGKVTYTNKKSDNLPEAGYNNQTLMYFLIIGTAPSINPEWFKPYWMPGLTGVQQKSPYNPGPGNPYIDIYENLSKINKNGMLGNFSANYEFTKKLGLMVRTGVDMAFEFRSQQRPYSQTKFPKGSYREQNVFNYEINTDALLTYKDNVNNSIKYSVNLGANAMNQTYDFAGIYADQLAQPGIYQLSNSLNQAVADPQKSRKAINSVYGSSQWSYLERIFLDLTGRNDWSSTLPYGNNSFFYPSVSTSFLLSDLFQLPKQVSFAKLRFSWAQVGNDTRPYQTSKYYDVIYSNQFTNSSTLFNPALKPEITTSYEAGLDIRLFKNRLSMDLAVYKNNSRNQIIAIPLDPVSGYQKALINAGLIESNGAEVQLKGIPVQTKIFKWTTTLNWSANRSYVKELANGVTTQVISANSGVNIEARVGGRMGDLYGQGFQRSPEGKIIYNSTGLPATLDPITKRWGNAFPDWKAGLMNEFAIKNFRVSILLDYQKGGSMYSQTSMKGNSLGKTKLTLPGRENGIVGDGVLYNPANKKYDIPNNVNVSAAAYYELYYSANNAETNTYDATYLKLREARIEYTLPPNLLKKIGISQTSIALYGRDLFNITKFPGFDPEGGNLNSGTITPGAEIMQFPSSRTIGVNLTVKF
jgi:TonB-linked SusC/RagA family outer membrane protein